MEACDASAIHKSTSTSPTRRDEKGSALDRRRLSMPTFPGVDLDVSATPLRRINTRGRVRPTGRFASSKMGRCLPWESSNELAWLQRAELDPEITAFYAQALVIELNVGGRLQSHTPDGVAVRRGRVEVHEVKPDADAATDAVRALAAAAARHVRLRGATYGLSLESALKAAPVHANMQHVLRRLHRRVPDALALTLVAEAQDGGPTSVAALARAAGRRGAKPEDVLALVARGRLRMDLGRAVTGDALVWAPDAFPNPVPILPFPTAPEALS